MKLRMTFESIGNNIFVVIKVMTYLGGSHIITLR